MALTPTPIPGELIAATWGTEVRDRTVQVFASTTERDGWAAGDGAVAYTTDTGSTWQRIAGVWRLQGNYSAGTYSGTTSSTGIATVPHALGVTPTVIQVTPSTTPANFASVQNQSRTATNFTIKCRSNSGSDIASATVSLHFVVFR